SIQSTSSAIKVHLRNPVSGKCKVVGGIEVGNNVGSRRTDQVRFFVDENGVSQIMFGAMHFSGAGGGADVSRIMIQSAGSQLNGENLSIAKRVRRRVGAEVRKRQARPSVSRGKGASANTARAGLPPVGGSVPQLKEPLAVPDH